MGRWKTGWLSIPVPRSVARVGVNDMREQAEVPSARRTDTPKRFRRLRVGGRPVNK
jgi:hypothetical protein